MRLGDATYELGPGDTVHCPADVSHCMRNDGDTTAKPISYVFPGYRVEDFMVETSRRNLFRNLERMLIERKFGVVYK